MRAFCLVLLIGLAWSPVGLAQLTIEITEGQDDPTSIAVVPFEWRGRGALAENISDIVAADLQRVGQFSPVAKEDMLGFPSQSSGVFFRDWRAIGAEYVLGLLPKGTHDFARFIRPSELDAWLRAAGLELEHIIGLVYNPLTRVYKLAPDVDVNYMLCCRKPGDE